MARTNPDDVLRLGPQVAAIKASLPKSRWRKFVKLAHARGHTVGGELRGGPDALKERTASSLRAEAQKHVATAYAPAEKVLSQREAALGYLNDKRKADDASYRTWLTGETEKLHAQARAADTALTTQQSTIASETKTAIEAARADSLKRMAALGGVSDPNQSTALDTSAADVASTQNIASARENSASLIKIGEDARTLAAASMAAQQSARDSSTIADDNRARGELSADKLKLSVEKAGATADKLTDLLNRNVSIAQANVEADLAGESLGIKRDEAGAAIAEAERKYKLETDKFALDKWKAENAATVEQAKIKLGYDRIASSEGQGAANRALNRELAKIRAKGKDKKKGVTQAERDLHTNVQSALSLLKRWHTNSAVLPGQMRQKLKDDYGIDDVTIAIAEDLRRNNGVLSPSGRAKARKLGIVHSGYFWPLPSSNPPTGPNPGG